MPYADWFMANLKHVYMTQNQNVYVNVVTVEEILLLGHITAKNYGLGIENRFNMNWSR